MRNSGAWAAVGSVVVAGTLFSGSASAQEVLPTPPPPFKGQIGLSAKDSKSDFPQPVQAPKGAPNIVLILVDDVGEDTGTPVKETYDVPFKFTGQIEKVVVNLSDTRLGEGDQQKLSDMQQKAKLATE